MTKDVLDVDYIKDQRERARLMFVNEDDDMALGYTYLGMVRMCDNLLAEIERRNNHKNEN